MVHAELQVTESTPSHLSLWGIKREVVDYQIQHIHKWLKEFCDQTVKIIICLLLFSYFVSLFRAMSYLNITVAFSTVLCSSLLFSWWNSIQQAIK